MLLAKGLSSNDIGLQFFADNNSSSRKSAVEEQLAHKGLALAQHFRRVRNDGALITTPQNLPGYPVREGLPGQGPLPATSKQKVRWNLQTDFHQRLG